MTTSSAKNKWLRIISDDPMFMPRIRPLRIESERVTWRPSIMMTNKKGDRGSSCLKPRLTLNSEVGLPLTKIEVRDDSRQALIYDLQVRPNPRLHNMKSRYLQLTESKAFSNSTLKSNIFFFLFLYQSMAFKNERPVQDLSTRNECGLFMTNYFINHSRNPISKNFSNNLVMDAYEGNRPKLIDMNRVSDLWDESNERAV
ncbi:hypothetical protein Tco_0574225 [Tanacetum coccineum]